MTKVFRMSRKPASLIHWPTLAAIHKGPNWAYEQEWRMINPTGIENALEIRMPCPVAIYMGAKISHEDEQRIRNIKDSFIQDSGTSVQLYKMKPSETGYNMEPQLVS